MKLKDEADWVEGASVLLGRQGDADILYDGTVQVPAIGGDGTPETLCRHRFIVTDGQGHSTRVVARSSDAAKDVYREITRASRRRWATRPQRIDYPAPSRSGRSRP